MNGVLDERCSENNLKWMNDLEIIRHRKKKIEIQQVSSFHRFNTVCLAESMKLYF